MPSQMHSCCQRSCGDVVSGVRNHEVALIRQRRLGLRNQLLIAAEVPSCLLASNNVPVKQFDGSIIMRDGRKAV